MFRSLVCVAAIAVALMPVAASAQGTAFLDDGTGDGRKARVAADRLIPAVATGELAGVRGKAWWQALIYCAAVYKVRDDALRAAGDQNGSMTTELEGKSFIQMSLQRMETDRMINADVAGDVIGPEFVYYFNRLKADPANHLFEMERLRCSAVRAQYEPVRVAP